MMNPIPTRCPVCGEPLEVTRLYCSACDTALEGHFDPTSSAFSQLTAEQLQFVLTFVRCEGRFNRMEEELKLSYPTIRNRLYEVIRALGYEPGREEPGETLSLQDLSLQERNRILEDLDKGAITYEQAMRQLKGLEPGAGEG
jgi:hypothetical protein